MSVYGELDRHLATLLGQLAAEETAKAATLRDTLEDARPASNGDLSAGATQILAALAGAGIPADGTAPEEFGPDVMAAVDTVVAICRIILGE